MTICEMLLQPTVNTAPHIPLQVKELLPGIGISILVDERTQACQTCLQMWGWTLIFASWTLPKQALNAERSNVAGIRFPAFERPR